MQSTWKNAYSRALARQVRRQNVENAVHYVAAFTIAATGVTLCTKAALFAIYVLAVAAGLK